MKLTLAISTACILVLTAHASAADLTVCDVSRASLSPDGRAALLYTPLRYERSHLEITAVDGGRRYMPASAGLGGVHLMPLDCETPDCAPTRVSDAVLAPWTDPAWSPDGAVFALPVTQGDRIAADRTAVTLIERESGEEIGRSGWLDAKLILPTVLAADLSPGAVRAMRTPARALPTGPQALSLVETADGPDPAQPAPFVALDPALQPLQAMRLRSGRLSWGDVVLDFIPGRRAHGIAVDLSGASALVSLVDPDGVTRILHVTRTETRTLFNLAEPMRMVVSDGEAVMAHGDRAAAALVDRAAPLVAAVNRVLDASPPDRLSQLTVSRDLSRAVLVLNREKRGRRIVLADLGAPAREILSPCEDPARGPDVIAETFRVETPYGAMPVRRLSDPEGEPSRTALLVWRSAPLDGPAFGAIDRFGATDRVDLFQIGFPAMPQADGFQTSAEVWNSAAALCAAALEAVRRRHSDAYDVIGVAGRGYGGLVAMSAMVEGGCEADFAAAFGPVLSLHADGAAHHTPRRDGLGHHPLEDAVGRLGPIEPHGAPRRDAPFYLYAAWPDTRYDPEPVATFVRRLEAAGAQAYWSLPVLSGLPPSAFATAPRPASPFSGPEAIDALAERALAGG